MPETQESEELLSDSQEEVLDEGSLEAPNEVDSSNDTTTSVGGISSLVLAQTFTKANSRSSGELLMCKVTAGMPISLKAGRKLKRFT